VNVDVPSKLTCCRSKRRQRGLQGGEEDIITQKPCVDLSVESFSDRCFTQCQTGAGNAATHVAALRPVRSRPPLQQEPQTLET
jgi:hypothetical protein